MKKIKKLDINIPKEERKLNLIIKIYKISAISILILTILTAMFFTNI